MRWSIKNRRGYSNEQVRSVGCRSFFHALGAPKLLLVDMDFIHLSDGSPAAAPTAALRSLTVSCVLLTQTRRSVLSQAKSPLTRILNNSVGRPAGGSKNQKPRRCLRRGARFYAGNVALAPSPAAVIHRGESRAPRTCKWTWNSVSKSRRHRHGRFYSIGGPHRPCQRKPAAWRMVIGSQRGTGWLNTPFGTARLWWPPNSECLFACGSLFSGPP